MNPANLDYAVFFPSLPGEGRSHTRVRAASVPEAIRAASARSPGRAARGAPVEVKTVPPFAYPPGREPLPAYRPGWSPHGVAAPEECPSRLAAGLDGHGAAIAAMRRLGFLRVQWYCVYDGPVSILIPRLLEIGFTRDDSHGHPHLIHLGGWFLNFCDCDGDAEERFVSFSRG